MPFVLLLFAISKFWSVLQLALFSSCQTTHQGFDGQKWCCIVAQVGPRFHDGIDLLHRRMGGGFMRESSYLIGHIYVDNRICGP